MRASRSLVAGTVVAVLAIAIFVGFQLRDRGQPLASPTASPTASASGATAVSPNPSRGATSTPAGTASEIYNNDFGFIVSEPGAVASIRTESSNARLASFEAQTFAMSPDGRLIAFWKPGVRPELRVTGGATEQTLVTLTADQRGGGVVWSSDGAGLLYSTERGNFGVGGDGTNSATLNVYEFAANGRHGTTVDTQTNTGWLYRPIAWDRSVNLAAAGLTGEGGQLAFYVTVRINPDNSLNVQRVDTRHLQDMNGMAMGSIRASSDAKLVLGVEGESGNIKWWPLADIAATRSQPGAGKRGALWRPGSHEIGFLTAEQLWLGDVDRSGPLGLCCTALSGVPATSVLRAFRADGTAVVLAAAPFRGTTADYTLVRLGNDPKATSGDRVTFQELVGLSASIRLR
jgi:hypothetical protein